MLRRLLARLDLLPQSELRYCVMFLVVLCSFRPFAAIMRSNARSKTHGLKQHDDNNENADVEAVIGHKNSDT